LSTTVEPFRPRHGALQRPGAKKPLRQIELPPWHGWRERSEAKRIVKWCEATIVQPTGVGQGRLMRIADFERKLTARIVDALATFVSIPTGNGKTTFMTAFALERLCRGDDYVEIDILATKEDQARRMVQSALRMVECSPALTELFDFHQHDCILKYRLTGSTMQAHPAKMSAIQGLDFNLCLIDEIGDVPAELVNTMIARLGKQPDSRVVGFGTPGTSFRENMLEEIRKMAHAGELPAGFEFVEYAADAGCSIHDEDQWLKANPAIDAGFLDPASMPLKAATMPEHLFRAYHLGQPVESSGPWLPHGAWDDCFKSEPPPDGARVVLAAWGNYRRQVALVGCTMDGALFFGWQAEKPTDDEFEQAIRLAAEQWDIVELVHKPHIRLGLMEKLADEFPVEPWPADVASDVESTAALYQAIAEHTIAHDHDPGLAEQVSRLTAKVDRHGNPRLVESSDPDVSLALAARAAWWRAGVLAESELADELVIY
jgi:hypothetical protein